ncbi:MAG: cobyrinate a,c-diamide synthase, partial [Methylococcales bacterium]
ADALVDQAGQSHTLLGILSGTGAMQSRLTAIGSQEFELFSAGMRGHTFHYSSLQTALKPISRAKTPDGLDGEAIYQVGSVIASYCHAYFPSNPELTARLFLAHENPVYWRC